MLSFQSQVFDFKECINILYWKRWLKKPIKPCNLLYFQLIKIKIKIPLHDTMMIPSWLQLLALAMQICSWYPTRLMGGSKKLLPPFAQTGFGSMFHRNYGIWHSIPGVINLPLSFLQSSSRAKLGYPYLYTILCIFSSRP